MIVILNKKFLRIIVAVILLLIIIITGTILYNRKAATSTTTNYATVNRPIERGNENSDYIAFACNVDWGNEVIPEILAILKEKEVKITFFVTGRWVKAFPEMFQEIVKAGHEIGSHGYQHVDYSKLTLDQNKEQIKQTEELIMQYSDKKPVLFAPPSGAYNEYTLISAQELGYKTILWSIDTIDWRQGSTRDVIVKRVIEKPNHRGAIVLMHPMPETAKALPTLIDELQGKNLKVGGVSDVLMD
ncbi:polysaccharide deacetylase family protein [Clostridium formicaceticum]|uniref:Peptidoglycan-N-acetylmuramic acid deacetylase PdaA n=1 Tax=Clostridium formicaceticum TaxID=1497 RepID=A0AAC9WGB7_9CLOT|nr:polysaccharide deacetylase family protein [Clostridium formicaceticum]AOY77268.1 polysaccharide deacetylase [Clostridium formicaceticum]ARE87807.1 Peptidoglycan-N-acetylmuramic acid deacetylase PdaA precursor [Clostridium formicaceticum]